MPSTGANKHSTSIDSDDSLWDSPEKPAARPKTNGALMAAKTPSVGKLTYEQTTSREEQLRQELASVRKVNETIESLVSSLERAKSNIKAGHITCT